MKSHYAGRRDFLTALTALGTIGLPGLGRSLLEPLLRVPRSPRCQLMIPAARYEIKVSEVEMRRNAAGRVLKARVYQPVGAGPFPTVLDLHGGAWNRKDRTAEEPMDRALAASGLLVVAVDLTVAR